MQVVPRLTPTEARVLELVAEGLPTAEIAVRLCVSHQAITYHVGNLFGCLQCQNRAGLVGRAFTVGVFEPGSWPPRVRKDVELPGGSPDGSVVLDQDDHSVH
jgi:DNA-binding CsgD family transcriptional regulator